jgi:outer membrane protein TolC
MRRPTLCGPNRWKAAAASTGIALAAVDTAHGRWSAQTNALKSALATLDKAVKGLSGGTSSISDVVTALGGVKTATTSLLAAADTRCPAPSPSS